jgi:hypothetical protein
MPPRHGRKWPWRGWRVVWDGGGGGGVMQLLLLLPHLPHLPHPGHVTEGSREWGGEGGGGRGPREEKAEERGRCWHWRWRRRRSATTQETYTKSYLLHTCSRGGRGIEDICYERRRAEACVDSLPITMGPVSLRNPALTQGAPVFPGSSRLGIDQSGCCKTQSPA